MIAKNDTSLSANGTGKRKWQWYHGVLFYAGVQAVWFGLPLLLKKRDKKNPSVIAPVAGDEENNKFYNDLKQPIFAPPDWAFAPVWTINNIFCIWGLLRVLNMPKDTPGRDAFIALQIALWVEFAAFNAAFFGLRSPLNSAALTVSYTFLTYASLYVALAKLKDNPTALSLSTVSVWVAIAAPTSVAIAAWNEDEFYDTEQFVEAPHGWVKSTVH